MAKASRRVQKSDRAFAYEKAARLLIRALNDEMGPAVRGRREVLDRRPLLLLVKRFQALEDVVGDKKIPLFSINSEGGLDDNPDVLQKYKAINRVLRRYIAVPVILPDYFSDPNPKLRGWELTWERKGHPRPFTELRLIHTIADIASANKISSLKQCAHCRRWLFARFSHQRFCSDECKESFHRTNDADKKRRREWARTNYWIQKNTNVK
jgi:hypothetical protein